MTTELHKVKVRDIKEGWLVRPIPTWRLVVNVTVLESLNSVMLYFSDGTSVVHYQNDNMERMTYSGEDDE